MYFYYVIHWQDKCTVKHAYKMHALLWEQSYNQWATSDKGPQMKNIYYVIIFFIMQIILY